MAYPLAKQALLADLRTRLAAHEEQVSQTLQPLSPAQLAWRPSPGEWSILLCLDHLAQTHVYYQTKLADALARPVAASDGHDDYRPSFWGRVYMAFAFNPRFSFPTPDALAPRPEPPTDAAALYLIRLAELRVRLAAVEHVDLRRTRVPIGRGVSFNVGDCLRILVDHDALHLRQAAQVAAAYRASV